MGNKTITEKEYKILSEKDRKKYHQIKQHWNPHIDEWVDTLDNIYYIKKRIAYRLTPKKTGVDEIAKERESQIESHGYTEDFVQNNPQYYDVSQMAVMAELLLRKGNAIQETIPISHYPSNWPNDEVEHMLNSPYIKRLIVAGALIAAEIDRIQNL